jgi:hypothetical protein
MKMIIVFFLKNTKRSLRSNEETLTFTQINVSKQNVLIMQ